MTEWLIPAGFEEVAQPHDARPNGLVHASPIMRDASGTKIGRLTLRRIGQFRPATIPKLIRGFLPEDALLLVYGAWGSGKSFFSVDVACKIACGETWRGRAVLHGAVLYVAGEGSRSIESRIRAWCLRYGKLGRDKADPPLGVIGTPPDLIGDNSDVDDIIAHARLLAEETGLPVRAVIFDTLHACAPGSKEDAADTGAVLSKARRIGDELRCAVIVIHHAGKDSGRGARGSSALEAAADVIVEIVEDAGTRTPIVRKMRDGDLPELSRSSSTA
jgi:RecA-family ATPase